MRFIAPSFLHTRSCFVTNPNRADMCHTFHPTGSKRCLTTKPPKEERRQQPTATARVEPDKSKGRSGHTAHAEILKASWVFQPRSSDTRALEQHTRAANSGASTLDALRGTFAKTVSSIMTFPVVQSEFFAHQHLKKARSWHGNLPQASPLPVFTQHDTTGRRKGGYPFERSKVRVTKV